MKKKKASSRGRARRSNNTSDYSPPSTSLEEQSSSFISMSSNNANEVPGNHTNSIPQPNNNNKPLVSPCSLFDDSLLEEEPQQNIIEEEIEEQVERMLHTVQISIQSVTNDPLFQKFSNSTRDLILAQCQDEDTITSDIRTISIRTSGSSSGATSDEHQQQQARKKYKKKKTPKQSKSNDRSGDPCVGCDVFSIMELYMDGMDDECAELNDSATVATEKTPQSKQVKFSSSPSDVRHFDQDEPPVDSSSETYHDDDDDDDDEADTNFTADGVIGPSGGVQYASPIKRSSHRKQQQHPSYTPEDYHGESDATPCRYNHHRIAPTSRSHRQDDWERTLRSTLEQKEQHKPCVTGVKRFFGRKLKRLQCKEQNHNTK